MFTCTHTRTHTHSLSLSLSPPPPPPPFSPLSVSNLVAGAAKFNSKQLGLRVQKKVIGKLANRTLIKGFIDDNLASLLDTLHLILKLDLGDAKKADKVIKNLIKITIKIGLLYKNKQFSPEELSLGVQVRTKFRHAALTVISFSQVDFSYDRAFLVKLVSDIGDMLHKLVDRHLTAKSHQRIDSIISALGKEETLDKVFLPEGAYHSHLAPIATIFDKVVDAEW